MADKKIENTIPVLPVADLQASIKFYGERLGFAPEWGGEPESRMASVSRDGHSIMLSQQAEPTPGCVWIGLTDHSLFPFLESGQFKVVEGPHNQPWAYEIKIADPDGNLLWFGAEPKNS